MFSKRLRHGVDLMTEAACESKHAWAQYKRATGSCTSSTKFFIISSLTNLNF